MAKLKHENFEFEFRFDNFDNWNYLYCEFYFRWNWKDIINEDILKRWWPYWWSRKKWALLCSIWEEEHFIQVIKDVLNTETEKAWESLEPDIEITISPLPYFLDYKNLLKNSNLAYMSDAEKSRQDAKKEKKEKFWKLPDDEFELKFKVDFYNFEESMAYGIWDFTFSIIQTRKELEKFIQKLESEYKKFCDKFWLPKNFYNNNDIDEEIVFSFDNEDEK